MSCRMSMMVMLAAAASAFAAQPASAQSAAPGDSARRLAPVIVSATPAPAPANAIQLSRENRRFARELSSYDRRIGQLESHLERLKTVVSDSLAEEAARLARATAETRARRLELEARLRNLERGAAAGAVEKDGSR